MNFISLRFADPPFPAMILPPRVIRLLHHRRSGFSLTELLIVVALIAVVSALAFPIFSHARAKSRAATCINHLRATGIAFQVYINDCGQQIVTRRGGSSRTGGDLWPAELSGRGYLSEPQRSDGYRSMTGDDPKLLTCPAGSLPANYSLTNWSWYTYGLNLFTPGSKSVEVGKTQLSIRKISSIAEPSKFVLLADSASGANNQQYFRISEGNAGIALRHGNRGHALFLDGHIEALTRQDAERLGFPSIYDNLQ